MYMYIYIYIYIYTYIYIYMYMFKEGNENVFAQNVHRFSLPLWLS